MAGETFLLAGTVDGTRIVKGELQMGQLKCTIACIVIQQSRPLKHYAPECMKVSTVI